MKKRFIIYLPLLFALVLIAGIYLGYRLSPVTMAPQLFHMNFNKYNKLNDVVNFIENEYVDSVNREQLSKDGIDGMLESLDPHSQYISAEEFHEVVDPLIGNFEGIGISFRIEKDSIVVIQTIPGGPSEKVGLLAGDRIIMVGDSLIAGVGITNKLAMKYLKGKRGTKVSVGIFRRGLTNLLDFEITRDVIPTFSVAVSFLPEPGIGYIKVSKFSATTFEEFKEATDNLLELGMEKLILDLRGNTGGYLQAATDMSDEFLTKDQLIVFTEGKNQPRESYYATSKGQLENHEIVVLIDGNSASASEIVAGALQDNDKGTIVGRRSFGKGLVQRQMDLLDGSALRLTVARYYTPTGRCIQKPYDRKNGFDDYYIESYHRYMNGELEEQDSIHLNDSLKYVTPGGKIVYGGGGIMPDIFVPVENGEKSALFNKLVNKGLMFRFAFEYSDKNRNDLLKFENFEKFNKQFEITSVLFAEFLDYAASKGIKPAKKEITLSKERIKTLLKANIARNLYDDKGFYPIYLTIDPMFAEAVEVLSK